MGLLTEVLLLPVAPVRVALWSIRQIVDETQRQQRDQVRRELMKLERDLTRGEIGATEFDRREDELLERLENLAQS